MDLPAPPQPSPDRAKDRAVAHSQATLTSDELSRMNAYWRAADYLSVGQIWRHLQPCGAHDPGLYP